MIYFKNSLRRDRFDGPDGEYKYIVKCNYTPLYDKIWRVKKFLFFYIKIDDGFLDFKGNFIK